MRKLKKRFRAATNKEELSFAPYLLWGLALLVTLFFLSSLVSPNLWGDKRDYTNPEYLKYKDKVSSCSTSFYGGARVPDKEPVVYDAWKSHMPIGC